MSAPSQPEKEFAAALALQGSGKLDQAESICRKLLSVPTVRPRALRLLGSLELRRGRHASALNMLTSAVKADPQSAEAALDLGNALVAAGRVKEAVACFRQATVLKPDYAGAHFNLGLALHAAEQLAPAEAALLEALRLNAQQASWWRQYALFLLENHRHDEALAALERAAALAPNDARLRFDRAETLFRKGDITAAAGAFRRLAEGKEATAAAWSGLGRALLTAGDFAGADESFRKALGLDAAQPDALRCLALMDNAPAAEAELTRLAAVGEDAAARPIDRVAAGFALGKKLDDAGKFDEAFARFAAANAAFRQINAAAGRRFVPEKMRATVDRLLMENPEAPAFVQSDLPVFVVGMPRSGTSLVEQILASHPAVFGAGELTDIHAFGRSGAAPTEDWARGHLARLQSLAPKSVRVVDKTPDNLFRLGLIARLFEQPRVILCQRDDRDTCLSCYFTYFTTGNLWSFDLADCGIRCAQTDRMARHWQKSPRLRVLTVRYETLVAELERESRRVIAFLDLPWNDACLNFHRTPRSVATPSFWQVRQPIYDRSVGRWQHYRSHLGPLLQALEQEKAKGT